ncbi:MAG: hypothetical protein ABEH40_05710 [Haloferacaceae archaeon]
MLAERAERLARFCRDRGGDHVRVVLGYDDEEYVVAHATEAAQARYSADEVDRLVDTFRAVHDDLWSAPTVESALGAPDAAVHHHGDVIVIHLLTDGTRGYLASFDRAAGSDLADFVDDCRLRVGGEMAD